MYKVRVFTNRGEIRSVICSPLKARAAIRLFVSAGYRVEVSYDPDGLFCGFEPVATFKG